MKDKKRTETAWLWANAFVYFGGIAALIIRIYNEISPALATAFLILVILAFEIVSRIEL